MEELQPIQSEGKKTQNEDTTAVNEVPETAIPELSPAGPTKMQEFIEFIRDLVIIFVIVIGIRTFIAAPFQIS